MTKEERIEAFNKNRSSSVKLSYYSRLDNYIELLDSAISPDEIPELIAVLTEAKEILEAE